MTWLLLSVLAHAVEPLAGVAYSPLGRSDLAWLDDGRTTGLGVGEFDGVVRPQLSAFGGVWLSPRVGLVGSLGIARLQATTWVGETWTQRHWGVVRPEVDVRWTIVKRRVAFPVPWLVVGVYGDIPSARSTSNGWSRAEQRAADEVAAADRARLGGVGARIGVGADYRITPNVAIGATWSALWHHATVAGSEALTVSSWVASDASLLLTFEWPKKAE